MTSKQYIGVSRGRHSTKIHAVVGLGNPLVLTLTGEEFHDSIMLQPALDELSLKVFAVLADKACEGKDNRAYITEKDANYCILPKENAAKLWVCDYNHYKEQYLVECFFRKIKDNRRIARHFKNKEVIK